MDKKFNLHYKGKFVGFIDFNRQVYCTHRTKDTFFYQYEGFGISLGIFDILEKYGIKDINIVYQARIYPSTTDQFLVKGTQYEWKGDTQLILPIREMRPKKRNLRELQAALS